MKQLAIALNALHKEGVVHRTLTLALSRTRTLTLTLTLTLALTLTLTLTLALTLTLTLTTDPDPNPNQEGIVHRDLKPENILFTSKAAEVSSH